MEHDGEAAVMSCARTSAFGKALGVWALISGVTHPGCRLDAGWKQQSTWSATVRSLVLPLIPSIQTLVSVA
jgi:hypothetical protein